MKRIKVVLSSIVTYATLAVFALTVVSEEFPGAARYIVPVVAALTAAVTVIRRVTPVLPDERGILPADTFSTDDV